MREHIALMLELAEGISLGGRGDLEPIDVSDPHFAAPIDADPEMMQAIIAATMEDPA